MTAPYYTQKTEARWDQSTFEELKASWSPERIAEDEKRLAEIFNLAAEVPLLKEALDWAEKHGVQFFVDRTLSEAWGYYKHGTGVLGIAAEIDAGMEAVIGTVVHEIRHAWQDYHGFSNWPGETPEGGFAPFFINNALMEADAEAVGKRAEAQYRAARTGETLAEEKADLAGKLLSWFASTDDLEFYGDHASKIYGQKWGVYDGALPEHHMEFIAEPVPTAGIDTSNIRNVMELGRGFSGGKSYFHQLPPDVLSREILSPSLASTFYGAASAEQKELVTEIRKVSLQAKLGLGKPERTP